MKLRLAFVTAIGSLALAACGSDDGNSGGDTVNPDGTHTQYVADTITIPSSPAEASQLGVDLDEDDVVDNALGQNLSILASQGVDLQGSVDEAIATGSVILLANVQATALDNATGVGFSAYLGANPSPAACTNPDDITTCGNHLDGSAAFEVDPASPTDALLVGNLVGGTFDTTAVGNVTLQLEIVEGQPPLELNLIGARTEFGASATSLSSGKLGGAITEDEARNNILPVIVNLVQAVVVEDCTGTPGDCCTAGSTGETVLNIFDPSSADCMVSAQEVEENDLIATVLSPDVDLLDASGNFAINGDGEDDSISLGLGFTAVGATFTRP